MSRFEGYSPRMQSYWMQQRIGSAMRSPVAIVVTEAVVGSAAVEVMEEGADNSAGAG